MDVSTNTSQIDQVVPNIKNVSDHAMDCDSGTEESHESGGEEQSTSNTASAQPSRPMSRDERKYSGQVLQYFHNISINFPRFFVVGGVVSSTFDVSEIILVFYSHLFHVHVLCIHVCIAHYRVNC